SSKFFQYGSVAKTSSPGSAATASQSLIPCDPSVSGSRQIVFLPPRDATCAVISRRKSTSDASRNACVTSPPASSVQTSQQQAQRPGSSTPTWAGAVQCGSSQKT